MSMIYCLQTTETIIMQSMLHDSRGVAFYPHKTDEILLDHYQRGTKYMWN